MWTKDAWGGPIQLVARNKAKTKNETGQPVFDDWELIAVGPESAAGAHIKALSRISRLLRRDSLRAALRAAGTGDDFLRIVRDSEAA